MILVKRNSSEFKQVKSLLEDYQGKPSRKKLVLLYALKPTEPLSEKILINKLKENAAVLYDMAYTSLLDCFNDRRYRLFRLGRTALYCFRTSAKSDWLQMPFELAGSLKRKVFPLKLVKSREK
jgi:hypothetical protein